MTVIDYKLSQQIDEINDVIPENPFKNKWISIIGDSLNTMEGWSNASVVNDHYGPNKTGTINCKNDCIEGKDCWWHILLSKLGAKLCVLNAIGASRILDDRGTYPDFTY